MKTFAALIVAGAAASASAQTELCITIEEVVSGSWNMSAELLNPTGSIVATISDLGFTMNGAGIAGFAYNSAFDADFFGPATVTATATQVDFLGVNALPPLNNAAGVDSSNPLAIATFNASSVSGLTLNGQVSGAYAGVPFPDVFFYQNADGSAGSVPFAVKIIPIPAPASAALLGLGGIAAIRRRR